MSLSVRERLRNVLLRKRKINFEQQTTQQQVAEKQRKIIESREQESAGGLTVDQSPSPKNIVIERLRECIYKNLSHDIKRPEDDLRDLADKVKNLQLGVHVTEKLLGNSSQQLLSITASKCNYNESIGLYHQVELLLWLGGSYEVRVNLFDRVESGTVDTRDAGQLLELVSKINVKSPYVVCLGLTDKKYQNLSSKLGYQPKSLFSKDWPWTVNRHVKCSVWHKDTINAQRSDFVNCCHQCKLLATHLDETLKKRQAQSFLRRRSGSHHRIAVLSPASKTERMKNIKEDRKRYKKIARKYWKNSKIQLNDKDNAELSKLISTIESSEHGRQELNNIFDEAEKSGDGRGKTLKQVWELDRVEFLKDQRKNATGRKGNKWSTATFRMAIAVFSRSPSAYTALRNLGILQLPCEKQVEKMVKTNTTTPGLTEESIAEEVKKYSSYQEDIQSKKRPKPRGIGALVFDETKVQSKILFDMNGGNVKGFAMTAEQLPFLHDIFESVEQTQCMKTNYILQFLWRDLTSSYSIIGPYFECEKSWDHSFLFGCLMRTVKLFTVYKFGIKILVCDGASSNVALLKLLSGYKARKLPDEEAGQGDEKYLPNMVFNNPFDQGIDNLIYTIICPSHQLKNQIAALYSSRPNATKEFEIDDIPLGWKAIFDQYARDQASIEQGCAPRVPGLRYNYVHRDVWTRLNVLPAKIMQQRYMISALKGYSDTVPPPHDAASVYLTANYLEACNQIFERGILARKIVKGLNSPVLQNIRDGFSFFVKWFEKHKVKVYRDNSPKARQRHFLAWQTWDLLRIMVSSFLSYSDWFFTHGSGSNGYFIAPIRINGSSIESLFSRLKFGAGGHLTALNYRSGLARIQARIEVDRHTDSGKGYRDESVVPGSHNSAQTVHSTDLCTEGRSRAFNLNATEFLFPNSVSQSTIGGRTGSNACTLIATLVGYSFVKNNLPLINTIRLPAIWGTTVVNCIVDGNTLYDMVFEGQAVFLDVEDAFECFADELLLSSYDENVCNCSNQDFAPIIGLISQLSYGNQRKAGVLITEGTTVAVLVTGEGQVIIVDSHQHGQNGAVVSVGSTAENVINWYGHSFQKYHNKPIGNVCTVTWLDFL